MKTITVINWMIIGIYCVLAMVIYLDANRSGIDAAGKGMAIGFLLVGLIYLVVLIGLNFIDVPWVRILVLLLGGLPLLVYASRALSSWQTQATYARVGQEHAKFKEPHLNAMMRAMGDYDVQEMETLLAKDNSRINQIGETNQRTILGIAIENASFLDTPEAREIVHLVVQNGGDPNVYHPSRYAPLARYGVYSDSSIFRVLLEAGADPNVLGEHAIPLLYTLIERGRDDVFAKVELLLKYGLDPNLPFGTDQPYQLNYSPVVWAAHYEQWAVCNLLINNGADVNFQPGGPDGKTFWLILEEKGNNYRAAGNLPADYQHLLSNEILINSKPPGVWF